MGATQSAATERGNDDSPAIEDLVRLIVVGPERSGKSWLLEAIEKGAPGDFPLDRDRNYVPTIGVDFKVHVTSFKTDPRANRSHEGLLGESHDLEFCSRRKNRKLQVWEAAGQERFRTITSAYYRGSQCVIITFNSVSRKSWDEVAKYLEQVAEYGTDDLPVVICATQIDRLVPELANGGGDSAAGFAPDDDNSSPRGDDGDRVDWDEVREFLTTIERRWAFCRVSALYGFNVEYLFALATGLAREREESGQWSVPSNTEDELELIASVSGGKMVKSASKR
jgi:Ras family